MKTLIAAIALLCAGSAAAYQSSSDSNHDHAAAVPRADNKRKTRIILSLPIVPGAAEQLVKLRDELALRYSLDWDPEYDPLEVPNSAGVGATWFLTLAQADPVAYAGLRGHPGVVSVERVVPDSVLARAGKPARLIVVARMPPAVRSIWVEAISRKYGELVPLARFERSFFLLQGVFTREQLETLGEELWVESVSLDSLSFPNK